MFSISGDSTPSAPPAYAPGCMVTNSSSPPLVPAKFFPINADIDVNPHLMNMYHCQRMCFGAGVIFYIVMGTEFEQS